MLEKFYKRDFSNLDLVSKFRLENAFLFAIGTNILYPVLIQLKGELLTAYVISMFLILDQFSVKTNRYFVKFTLSTLYKLGIYLHVLFSISVWLYFVDKLTMVLVVSAISIILFAIFSAYSIKLNNYLTNTYPENMNEFQIIRNSTWADGLLIGLAISAVLTFFFDVYIAILVFFVYNIFYIAHLCVNYNFYENYD